MSSLFDSRGPCVMLWEPDGLLASLLLRFADYPVEVSQLEAPAQLEAACRDRSVVLMVGPDRLQQPDQMRLLHRWHREFHVLIIGCGPIGADVALVAGEVGVAAFVSTLHDAVSVAPMLHRFLRSNGRPERLETPFRATS